MKVCLLSSGSVGNSIVIECLNDSLLIDCGISYKKFNELLMQTNLELSKIKNVLVTHEHSDHVKGIGIISRKLKIPIWTSKGTAECLYNKNILKENDIKPNIVEKYKDYPVGSFQITPFPLSHDAKEPMGFLVKKNEKKIAYITDTGYVSTEVKNLIKNADVYMFELNHNVEMLHMSQRPWNLKHRILSDDGHLSNEDAAYVLTEIIGDKTKHIYLSHISQEANLPEVAMMTLKEILTENGIDTSQLNLHYTYPLRPSCITEI